MKYFVLSPRSKKYDDVFAHASREAMKTYADIIEQAAPDFAQEIRDWRSAEILRQTSIFND